MHYNVNIYGGGDVKLIIQDLRKLAQKLQDNQHDDLTGDGFETRTLVLELNDGVEESPMPEASEKVVCTDKAFEIWKAQNNIQ